MKKQSKFPKGWDSERVKRVLEHYETQSENEAVAEDEAAYEDPNQTFIKIPNELVPAVRELIAKKSELTQNAWADHVSSPDRCSAALHTG
jgi:hypothetical protein